MIYKATGMVHLAPCQKNITTADTAKLLSNTVVRFHGIPMAIYFVRGADFIASSWQELWWLLGADLGFSRIYHPQTQGVVERMSSVLSQTIRCLNDNFRNVRE